MYFQGSIKFQKHTLLADLIATRFLQQNMNYNMQYWKENSCGPMLQASSKAGLSNRRPQGRM